VKRYPSPEALTLGICLTVLGLVWTLSNLGVLEALPLLRKWWPLSLVMWGLLELVVARATGSAEPPAGTGSAQERS
jgi:hypothetical protein